MATGTSNINQGGTGVAITVQGGGGGSFSGVGLLMDIGGTEFTVAGFIASGLNPDDALVAADAAATGAGGGVITVGPNVIVDLTASITTNNPVLFMGGKIRPTAGARWTGTVHTATPRTQIFDISSSAIADPIKLPGNEEVKIEWFGPSLNASADAVPHLIAARRSREGYTGCKISLGWFTQLLIDSYEVPGSSRVLDVTYDDFEIEGKGFLSQLKMGAGMNDWDFFRSDSSRSGFGLFKLSFDGNGPNNLVDPVGAGYEYQQSLLAFTNVHRVVVEDVWVQNWAGQRVFSLGNAAYGTRGNVTQVRFSRVRVSTVADQVAGNTEVTDHSTFWCVCDDAVLEDVTIEGATMGAVVTGVEWHGSRTEMRNLKMKNLRSPILLVADWDHLESVHVTGVTITTCQSAVWMYGSSFANDYLMDDITVTDLKGTQAGEVYPWIDFNPMADTLPGSRIEFTNVKGRNITVSPSNNIAFFCRLAAWRGDIRFNNCEWRDGPCGMFLAVSGIIAGASSIYVDGFKITDCGRTSAKSGDPYLGYGIGKFNSAQGFATVHLNNGTFVNTAGGKTPATRALHFNCPIGLLHYGAMNFGSVDMGLDCGITPTAMSVYHLSGEGSTATWSVDGDPTSNAVGPVGATITTSRGVHTHRGTVGDKGNWQLTTYGDSQPTGFRRQGDIHWKRAPVAAGAVGDEYVILGWIVTASGTMGAGLYEEMRVLTGG